MIPAVETCGLVKDYGRTRALRGVDLRVLPGEVFGFLGPNGAGKSTTIRLIMDLLRPTAGTVEVFGVAPAAGGPRLRARIGYLPGELSFPARTTARDHLRYLAALRGGRGVERAAELAERFSLDLSRPLRSLSKGNKQKVGLVQAFMHEPELLVLDEPTGGLDPLLQREFRALARESVAGGATIFLSSHVLGEVEEVAGRVAIIRDGRVVDVDDVRALRARAGQEVLLRFADPVALQEFAGLPGVHDAAVDPADGRTLTCLLRGDPMPLLGAATRHRVVRWQAQDRELEDLFIDFYRDPERSAATTAVPPGPPAGPRHRAPETRR
ncbi:ABC transporter ATP-binding protein [Kocuria sp. M1R5S2]|uniref:ABC transporter ATP-binding protein n=1 Tax=Kocuria rhizosphaerae TaxID=3376285 RepID=UPI0037AD0FAB